MAEDSVRRSLQGPETHLSELDCFLDCLLPLVVLFLVMVWWCSVRAPPVNGGTGGNLVVVVVTPQATPETYDVIGRLGSLRQVYPCTGRGHPTVYFFPQANQETSFIFLAPSAQL